jgi:hypothetical protein
VGKESRCGVNALRRERSPLGTCPHASRVTRDEEEQGRRRGPERPPGLGGGRRDAHWGLQSWPRRSCELVGGEGRQLVGDRGDTARRRWASPASLEQGLGRPGQLQVGQEKGRARKNLLFKTSKFRPWGEGVRGERGQTSRGVLDVNPVGGWREEMITLDLSADSFI